MLLLITGSLDATADRLVAEYGEGLFRFNFDLWRDYRVSFTENGWKILNPVGLEITSDSVAAAFWWKAFSFNLNEDNFIKAEVRYVFRDIFGWCQLKGFMKGNPPDFHNRFGKFTILGIARKYFKVPPSLVTVQKFQTNRFENRKVVAKSLSSEQTSEGTVLFTTPVEIDTIDPNFIWYLQQEIQSDFDVTVLFCDGQCFAFERSRSDLAGLDWRKEQTLDFSRKEWFPFQLTADEVKNICEMSNEMGVEFGRYDFLREKSDGTLIFLEFNASGQWVFLDVFNEYNLLSTVAGWLKRPAFRHIC